MNAFADKGKEGRIINNKLLNELYRTYYREIYLYLYSLCRRSEPAEDLAQETFLKALLSLKDSHSNMRAWLYTVARNLYFNYSKAEKHIADDEISDICDEVFDDKTLSSIIQKEENRLLYMALNKLSRTRREVLIMHYFGGLSQKEIASALNLTPSNVRVLTLRAKQEIRQYLEVNKNDIP